MSSKYDRKKLLTQIGKDTQTFSTQVYLFKQQVAERLGLHPTDFQCINILDQHGPLTAGMLAKQLGLTTGATTTLIDRLEEAGYARRLPDQADKRKVQVTLSGPGLTKMRGIFKPIEQQMDAVWQAFSDAELATIAAYLERMLALGS